MSVRGVNVRGVSVRGMRVRGEDDDGVSVRGDSDGGAQPKARTPHKDVGEIPQEFIFFWKVGWCFYAYSWLGYLPRASPTNIEA